MFAAWRVGRGGRVLSKLYGMVSPSVIVRDEDVVLEEERRSSGWRTTS